MGMINKNNGNFEEKAIADQVADELLTVHEKKDVGYLVLVLIFIVCLIFLVSSVSFAALNSVVNNNAIDININVDKDDDDINKRPDGNSDNKHPNNGNNNTGVDNNKNDDSDNSKDKNNGKDDNTDNRKPTKPSIDRDMVLFTFNSGSNYINMKNVFSMTDAEGIALKGDKEYFDFNVSASLKSSKKGSIVYEISLLPSDNNTISEDFIRVYMTENESPVSILNKNVSNFSELPKSKFSSKGRVIYKRTVNSSFNGNYVFKMWVSSKADFSGSSKKFGCRVMVNAYYK